MIIGTLQLGVPSLMLETDIDFSTPRIPTAFELVIVQVLQRFSHNRAYGETLLKSICTDVLCISDPESLVKPMLSELHLLDVISYPNGTKDFSCLTLNDLLLTEKGQLMMHRGMLPGVTETSKETFFFDPIANVLLSEKEARRFLDEEPPLSLDASLFEDLFPEKHIRTMLQRKKPDWYTADTYIETIRCSSTQTRWRLVSCSVVWENTSISIIPNEKDLAHYLVSIESEETFERVLDDLYDTHNQDYSNFPYLREDEYLQTNKKIQGILQVSQLWPSKERFCLPGLFYHGVIPEQAPPQQLIVRFADEGVKLVQPVTVSWNDTADGCTIWINSRHPFEFVHMITTSEWVANRKLKALFGQVRTELNITVTIPTELKNSALQPFLDEIIREFSKSSISTIRMTLLFLMDEMTFLHKELASWAQSSSPLADLLGTCFATIDAVERILGRVDRPEWVKGFWCICVEEMKKNVSSSLAECVLLLSLLSAYGPFPLDLINSLFRMVPPDFLVKEKGSSLLALLSGFHALHAKWYPPLASAVFSPETIAALLANFPELEELTWLEQNPLFALLYTLKNIFTQIEASYSSKEFTTLETEKDYRGLLKPNANQILYGLSKEWIDTMEALEELVPESSFLSDSHLKSLDSKIRNINKWAASLDGELPPGTEQVFVFDTSALLDEPKIVATIRPKELYVISKRVIEELDNKKSDERLRKQVANVLRNLDGLNKKQLHFCDGDLSLLSPDYQMKGDNLILSVAVRYRLHGPILVTSDKNLAYKAQIENIATMTSQQYLDRPKWSVPESKVNKTKR